MEAPAGPGQPGKPREGRGAEGGVTPDADLPLRPRRLSPTPEGRAGRPRRARVCSTRSASATHAGAPTAWTWPAGWSTRPTPHAARRRQPGLAPPLRPRPGPHRGRLRHGGRAADAPGASRLPGAEFVSGWSHGRVWRVWRGRGGPAGRRPPTPQLPTGPLKSLIRLIVTSATYRQILAGDARGAASGTRRTGCWAGRTAGGWRRRSCATCTSRPAACCRGRSGARASSRRSRRSSTTLDLPRASCTWKTSAGEDRYRRGMYTFFKRTIPDPNLVVFDCPDASATLARRNTSNTPLQALATLNNEVYLEAARALARRLATADVAGDAARVNHAFRLCVARPPQPDERDRLLGLLAQSRGVVPGPRARGGAARRRGRVAANRRGGVGGVDLGRERPDEPRRVHHAGIASRGPGVLDPLRTRRDFLTSLASGGLGMLALGSLLDADGVLAGEKSRVKSQKAIEGGGRDGAPAALRAAGEAVHLHLPGRGAVAAGPLRPEAQAAEVQRAEAAGVDAEEGPVRLHQQGREAARPARASSGGTGSAGWSSPTCSRTSPAARTTSAWSGRCRRTSSTTTPAIMHIQCGQAKLGPPGDGLVAGLRAGEREPEPARLRRAHRRARRQRRGRPSGAAASSARPTRASSSAPAARRC